MTTRPNNLRDVMPSTAAFIDTCREIFGAEMVNAQIKLGIQGAQTFYASENSTEVGTQSISFEESRGITLDKMVIIAKVSSSPVNETVASVNSTKRFIKVCR